MKMTSRFRFSWIVVMVSFAYSAAAQPVPSFYQREKLTPIDNEETGAFGGRIVLEGDTLAISRGGSPSLDRSGAIYILERDPGGPHPWRIVQRLSLADGNYLDGFPSSLALNGNTLVAGSSRGDGAEEESGVVYVFERGDEVDSWSLAETLFASDARGGDEFGNSVALQDDLLIVGATEAGTGTPFPGAAYVFERDLGGVGRWGLRTRLLPPEVEGLDNLFGSSIAIDGDTLVIGMSRDSGDVGAYFGGSTLIFERDLGGPDAWGLAAKLTSPEPVEIGFFGGSVAIQGDLIAVGETGADVRTGAVHLFGRNEGGLEAWGLGATILARDALSARRFGEDVRLNGDRLFVGNREGFAGGEVDSGLVYVFERESAESWVW